MYAYVDTRGAGVVFILDYDQPPGADYPGHDPPWQAAAQHGTHKRPLPLFTLPISGDSLARACIHPQIFKAYAVQTLAEGTAFVQDLKLGHYVKLPPRATFVVQLVATTLVGLLQVGVKEWMFANIPDICQPNQKDALTCPHNQVLYTTSAIWGLIGPARQFGTDSIYHPQLYAIAIGAVLPLPFWLWQRRWPNKWNHFVNLPIVLNGIGLIPPATGINYSSWFLVGFIFQFLVRRRNFVWWSKFNYVLTAAFDCGTVLSVLFIFFTLQFPRGGFFVNWWGNTVYLNSASFARFCYEIVAHVRLSAADYNHSPLRTPPDGGIR